MSHEPAAEICICRKVFANDGSLLRHQASCRDYLTNISILASSAGTLKRKRRRQNPGSEPEHHLVVNSSASSIPTEPNVDLEISRLSIYEPLEPEPSRIPSPIPMPETEHGRPIRANRGVLPVRFHDFLPEGPTPLPVEDESESPNEAAADTDLHLPTPEILPSKLICTPPNSFGLVREYLDKLPRYDPDGDLSVEDFLEHSHYTQTDAETPLDSENQPPLQLDSDDTPSQDVQRPFYAPYPNQSVYDLDRWYWGQPLKSMPDFAKLTHIITSPSFVASDIDGVNWTTLHRNLGSFTNPHFDNRDAWKKSTVPIIVPSSMPGTAPPFLVEGVFHKSLVDVIRSRFESYRSKHYHYIPHHVFWQPTGGSSDTEQEIFGELYNSLAWIEEHARLQKLPPEPGCFLERCIAALMLWSDATHLADYGSASLWPMYLQFGNESKYTRGQPSKNAFVHLAYIKSLPKSILEFIRLTQNGKNPSPQTQTHCKRELMHGILKLLLDDEFRHAYIHGIVVLCSDGISRRLYPRFFVYSADYPEKALLATIRDMGNCPCPRCLTPLKKCHRMGLPDDILRRTEGAREDTPQRQDLVKRARDLIYKDGYNVNSIHVERILMPRFLVPTENAFSVLSEVGLDFHRLLQPDLLHEWDIGIIQRAAKHTVRILYASGSEAKTRVAKFDERYNLVPAFGSVRTFGSSVSEFSKFAAHNYSDLLVCIIPVIEDLLPEPHNTILLDWFFMMNYTYGLAKFRLHTSHTVDLMDAVVLEFGKLSRKFKSITCAAFATFDLPKEAAARIRQKARAAKKAAASGLAQAPAIEAPSTSGPPTAPVQLAKHQFSLDNYKYHSAGDLTKAIRTYGTLDSYNSQLGEVEHKRSKSKRYDRTSKKDFEAQLASMDIRDQRLQNIEAQQLQDDGTDLQQSPFTALSAHHFIGVSQKTYIHIGTWLRENAADRAAQNFFPRLKDHLLARIDNKPHDGGENLYTTADHAKIEIVNGRMYSHQTFRINYTTYDIRRAQDVVKSAGPRQDIMMISQGTGDFEHTTMFSYARVIGIYHINIIDKRHLQSRLTRMEFLLVRWFMHKPGYSYGWKRLRLPQVTFVAHTELHSFSFVDPSNVIRGVQLIPAFAKGRTNQLLGYSRLARGPQGINDHVAFYVNWFADRDMMMRYMGSGVGHTNMPQCDPHSLFPPVEPDMDDDMDEDPTPQNEEVLMEDDDEEDEEPDEGEEEESDDDELDAMLQTFSAL